MYKAPVSAILSLAVLLTIAVHSTHLLTYWGNYLRHRHFHDCQRFL